MNKEHVALAEHKYCKSTPTTAPNFSEVTSSSTVEVELEVTTTDTDINPKDDVPVNDTRKLDTHESDCTNDKQIVDNSESIRDIPREKTELAVKGVPTVSNVESATSKESLQSKGDGKDSKASVTSISSRPQRACKSTSFINREGACRHGCIGCNSVLKRFVAKSSKKPSKRKASVDEDSKSPSKVCLTNGGSKTDVEKLNESQVLSHPEPQTEPMDLSKPSKKISSDANIKPSKPIFLKPKKNILLVKMKTATPKKIKHLLQMEERKSKKTKHVDDLKSKKVKSLLKLDHKPKNIRHIMKMKTGKPKKIKSLIKVENLVKMENKKPKKMESVVCLPNTNSIKSVVLGGKSPIIRLQKLTQRDVLDLSSMNRQKPDLKTNSVSISPLKCVEMAKEEEVESDGIEVERIVNGQKIEPSSSKLLTDTEVNGSTTEEPMPNFERDLLQLTTGFDD